MIRAEGLVKYFGNRLALNQVNLEVGERKLLVIFGPNGAGKTTLLKIISTLMRPSGGKVMVGGYELAEDPGKIRRLIGFMTHSSFLYKGLTGYENLKLYAGLYGVKNAGQRIHSLAEQVEIADRLDDLVQSYSRGMKQRLTIARALVHHPPYLLLDEPFTGLDERMGQRFNLILQKLKNEGKTTILTTHNVIRGHFIADEVAILNSGRLVFKEKKRKESFQRIKDYFHSKVTEK